VLDKEFSIKILLVLALFVVSGVSVVGYLLIGPTPMYDATTMGITLAICGLLSVALAKSDDALFSMFALLTAFFHLFIFTRVLFFQYFPERTHLPLSVVLSARQINFGYAYIALGATEVG